MAVPTIHVDVKVTYNLTSEYSNDGVSIQNDQAGPGTNAWPLLVLAGDDTITDAVNGKLKWQAHGDNTIGTGATLTLDFTTLTDRLTGTVIGAATHVYYGIIAIVTPDGTKKFRIGPNNDAAAVTFGMAPVAAYQDRTVDWLYDEPYAGSLGDKILIKNPGASTIDISWSFTGG